jgi:hypothetical protein
MHLWAVLLARFGVCLFMSSILSSAASQPTQGADLFHLNSFRGTDTHASCLHPDIERACNRASFAYHTQSHREQEAQLLKRHALALLRTGSWREKPLALATLLDAKLTLASANRQKKHLKLNIAREAIIARLSPDARTALQDDAVARAHGLIADDASLMKPWRAFAAIATSVAVIHAPLAGYARMGEDAVHLLVCSADHNKCRDLIMTKSAFEQGTRQGSLPENWRFVANCQYGWLPPPSSGPKDQRKQPASPNDPVSTCCAGSAKIQRPREEGGFGTGACCS